MRKKILFTFLIALFTSSWAIWVVKTHPQGAIVSWDEGFHGGTAFYISQGLRNHFNFDQFEYIRRDFINGLIWYLPLWYWTAAFLGTISSPSVEIFRLATLLIAVLSILLIAYFAKVFSSYKASIIASVSLAFIPVFVVYSHLMMIELPQLFSVSLALLFFYRYLSKEKLKRWDYLLTLLAFALGVMTKITAIVLIITTVLVYGLVLFIFFKKSLEYKRFFSWWTLYFISTSLIVFNHYRTYTRENFNADMLLFYIDQAKQMGTSQKYFLFETFSNLSGRITFYTKDFLHAPLLSLFWFGSLLSYFFISRTPLSVYLLIWTFVTYLVFSAVRPQVPQYLMSVFAPLSLAVGLFWAKLLDFKDRRFLSSVAATGLVILITFGEISNLNNTETIIWRKTITNQEKAAKFVASQASLGQRVLSSGDGTRLLLRIYGFDKKLQTINGAGFLCPQSMEDATDWAISDLGPQNPIKLQGLETNNWQKVKYYPSLDKTIDVFKNSSASDKIVIEEDDLVNQRCARWLPLGENKVTFYAKFEFLSKPIGLKPNLVFEVRKTGLEILNSLSLDQQALKGKEGSLKQYSFVFSNNGINDWIFFNYTIPKNIDLKIKKIVLERI
ncbi:glycosyltransferase family 39 protein [Candidatus Daviesbacteria bacterium]|nr:glycosyltransferase family 39 protein [Candidatus Daviesbacteria bacterium]